MKKSILKLTNFQIEGEPTVLMARAKGNIEIIHTRALIGALIESTSNVEGKIIPGPAGVDTFTGKGTFTIIWSPELRTNYDKKEISFTMIEGIYLKYFTEFYIKICDLIDYLETTDFENDSILNEDYHKDYQKLSSIREQICRDRGLVNIHNKPIQLSREVVNELNNIAIKYKYNA